MSRDIIKLDQIDVDFHQKKRTITAVKDATIHIQEGISTESLDILSREINPVRVINLCKSHLQGKLPLTMM